MKKAIRCYLSQDRILKLLSHQQVLSSKEKEERPNSDLEIIRAATPTTSPAHRPQETRPPPPQPQRAGPMPSGTSWSGPLHRQSKQQ